MSDLPLSNANIPYPDFVLHTVIDPDKFDLNNAELQGKLNATITQVNLNTPEIALKAYKTYVDSQDANLQSQITSLSSSNATKATIAYVDSENNDQDTIINSHTSTLATHTSQISTAQSDILLRTVNTGNHAGTWQGNNPSYFDNQIALKANTSDVYTKAQVDTGLNGKADKTTTYTKVEVDNALALKANSSDMATQLATKANVATTYTKTEVDNLLSPKATTSYVDSQLALKANTSSIYTQAQLNATTTGASGAHLIGSATITGVTGTTVYAQLANLKTQIDGVAAGGIPDGSVTPAKLDRAYLQLTGGTLSGTLTGTTINATTLQEAGTNLSAKYATLSGATFTGTVSGTTINASANLQEGGTNLSAKYLQLVGGTLTGDIVINKSAITASLSVGSSTDDTRYKIFTSGAKVFFQSGNNAWSSAKDLEIAGYNAFNIPTLTLRATSTVAVGTIQGTTINATTNLQEAGVNLSSKYLALTGGTLTNTLTGTTINATSNLQENGTNLTAKYAQLSGATFSGAVTIQNTLSGTGDFTLTKVSPAHIFSDTDASYVNAYALTAYQNKLEMRYGANSSANTTVQFNQYGIKMARSGKTYTGASAGEHVLDLNNSDVIGANGIHFNDTSDSNGEGLNFLKSTGTAGSTLLADYYGLRVDGSGRLRLDGDVVASVETGTTIWTGSSVFVSTTTITPTVAITNCPNGWMLEWRQSTSTAFLHHEPVYKFTQQDSVQSINAGYNAVATYAGKNITISGGGTTLVGSDANNTGNSANRVLTAIRVF